MSTNLSCIFIFRFHLPRLSVFFFWVKKLQYFWLRLFC
ncbi:hypothetical protein OIU76_007419 [Salix suchowensis]|nr:hypothetical protein OIU76_007419 [Salix suchowensis]